MAIIQNKTLLLLIDFNGHPILGDDHTNNLRYSELMDFLNNDKELNIVSNHLLGEYPTQRGPNKLKEIKRIYDNEGVHNWDRIDPDREPPPSIVEIENIFSSEEYFQEWECAKAQIDSLLLPEQTGGVNPSPGTRD